MMTYLSIPKNETYEHTFHLVDSDFKTIDVTGATGTLIVKECRECTTPLISKTVELGALPLEGELKFTFSPADTAMLPIRSWASYFDPFQYFLKITLPDGNPEFREGPVYIESTGVSDDDVLVNVFTGYNYSRQFAYAGETLSFTGIATGVDIVADGWEVVFEMKRWWDYEYVIFTKKLSNSEIVISDTDHATVTLVPSETIDLDNSNVYTMYIEKGDQRLVIDSGYIYIRRSA